MNDTPAELSDLIKILGKERVFIQTHNFPDPDAVASAFGLQQLLRHFGIEAVIFYKGNIEKLSTLRMLKEFDIQMVNSEDITDMTEKDEIITIDAQKYNSNCTDFIGDEIACIDHHPTVYECEYKFSDIRLVGACSSIVAEYYFANNIPMTMNVATALLYGIKMDTADFTRGVTVLETQMYTRLFPLVNSEQLTVMETNTMEFTDLKAYGNAIQNIQIYENIGFADIPFDCPDGLIAMISDFILALDIIEFAVVYAKRDAGYKFSVRSELKSLDAGKITAKALDGIGSGGGHATMAGGFVYADKVGGFDTDFTSEVENRFINAVHNTY